MKDLLQKHPDLEDTLRLYENTRIYKVLSDTGRIKEFWEKNNGHWTNQTEREKLREQIEELRDELEAY